MATVAQPRTRERGAPDSDRNLALELVRATEAAAINCSRYMGFGDKWMGQLLTRCARCSVRSG